MKMLSFLKSLGAGAAAGLVVGQGHEAAALPDDPWRYFNRLPTAMLVPLGELTPTSPPEASIRRARDCMRRAYRGEIAKRDPLGVTPKPGGGYLIQDGSATFITAERSGWKAVPVVIAHQLQRAPR